MDSTLIAGIIGGASTIAAVIVTPISHRYITSKVYYPISTDRRKILPGSWTGIVNQTVNESTINTFNVDLELKINGKRIEGTGVIKADKLYHVTLDGHFRNDKFLKMDYQNRDIGIVQFGSFVFHLSDDSKTLTGKFVGYGHISKIILHGNCEFVKD